MADQKNIIRDVVEILHDGHKGFADLAEHIKDPEVKTLFIRESQTRAKYARELESVVGLKREEGGTTAGALLRAWGDIKGKLGGGDHTLLETAEQGEDAAKEAYEKALKDSAVTGNVRQVLARQQTHIQQTHNLVKALRDRKAA